jgi:hypothetical protein
MPLLYFSMSGIFSIFLLSTKSSRFRPEIPSAFSNEKLNNKMSKTYPKINIKKPSLLSTSSINRVESASNLSGAPEEKPESIRNVAVIEIAEDIIEPNGRESTIDARQLQATSPKSDDSKNKEIYEISPIRYPRQDSPHPYNLRLKRPKPERSTSPEAPKSPFSKRSENELRLSLQMSDICSSDLSEGEINPFD